MLGQHTHTTVLAENETRKGSVGGGLLRCDQNDTAERAPRYIGQSILPRCSPVYRWPNRSQRHDNTSSSSLSLSTDNSTNSDGVARVEVAVRHSPVFCDDSTIANSSSGSASDFLPLVCETGSVFCGRETNRSEHRSPRSRLEHTLEAVYNTHAERKKRAMYTHTVQTNHAREETESVR